MLSKGGEALQVREGRVELKDGLPNKENRSKSFNLLKKAIL